MTFLYRMEAHSYEGGPTCELMHDRKFLPEEFQALVLGSLVTALDSIACRAPTYNAVTSLRSLHESLVTILCTEHGFKAVEYEAEFSYFGWRHLDNDGFKGGNETETAERMVKVLSDAGFTQEFFSAWEKGQDPFENAHDLPGDYSMEHKAGYDAGFAFRLNELLGRKFFKSVVS
jgi:hypothetical protein